MSEINYLKNNNSTQYLKNVYNILFYESKTQINFRNLFYEKVFDINSKHNDFLELGFKISLQYENIFERSYIKSVYQIFDENDNSLYIKSVNNNDCQYYSNRYLYTRMFFIILLRILKK